MNKFSFLLGICFSGSCIFICTLIQNNYMRSINRNLRSFSEIKINLPKVNHKWSPPLRVVQMREKECEEFRTSKTGGFCISEKRKNIGGNEIVDESLAEYLAKNVFVDKTVVDLGAGLGHYGKYFRKEGSKVAGWVGYDGALNVNRVTDGLVKFMDLTQPDAGDERECDSADWVMSLEVGEHIPSEYADAYLRNIRCHAREGAVISWAQQGGHMHVNMQPIENVMKMMEEWGFRVDSKRTKELQEASKRYYFKRNAVVYVL